MGFRKKTMEAKGSKTLSAHRKERAAVKAKEAKQRMDAWKKTPQGKAHFKAKKAAQEAAQKKEAQESEEE